MNIHPIPALADNYIWLIEDGSAVVAVDPGEAQGVIDYLAERQLNLAAILLTHDHADHTGGVAALLARFPQTPVYGPEETAPLADHVVQAGDAFGLLGHSFQVYETAGHTLGHISYLMGQELFCGDALFSAGCGRVFTGDYQAQYEALQWFKRLADDIKVYAAHEYTQTNLRFAQSVEPGNQAIAAALATANTKRACGLPTLPSTIGQEKAINLFLQAPTLAAFIDLRQARDRF